MEKEQKELVDFVVTARKYKTTLTEKFKNRPVWHKPYVGDVISHLPGTIVELEVKVGDVVLFGKYSGTELHIDDKKYLVMNQNDILVIM